MEDLEEIVKEGEKEKLLCNIFISYSLSRPYFSGNPNENLKIVSSYHAAYERAKELFGKKIFVTRDGKVYRGASFLEGVLSYEGIIDIERNLINLLRGEEIVIEVKIGKERKFIYIDIRDKQVYKIKNIEILKFFEEELRIEKDSI